MADDDGGINKQAGAPSWCVARLLQAAGSIRRGRPWTTSRRSLRRLARTTPTPSSTLRDGSMMKKKASRSLARGMEVDEGDTTLFPNAALV
jgi:hypothetical protein